MKHWLSRRGVFIGALAFFSLFSAACVGGLPDASWGHTAVVGDPAKIILAFSDRVVMVDPLNGAVVNQNEARSVSFDVPQPEATAPPEATDEAAEVPAEVTAEPTVAANAQGVIPPWEVRGVDGAVTNFFSAPLIYDPETLIVASYEGSIFETRLATGSRLSTTTVLGRIVDTPLLVENRLYVPIAEGRVVALERQSNGTWDTLWTFTADQGIWATPLLHEGILYVSSLDHSLYALDPQTGAEIWTLDLGGAVTSRPVLEGNFLYVGTFARKLYRISLDGQIAGEYTTNDWIWDSPVIADGVLYAGDASGWVYALRIDDGQFTPVWTPRQVATRAIRATPLVAGDRVIVGSRDRFVYWISRDTGEEILKREVRGEVLSDLMLLEPSESLRIPEPLVLVTTMARDQMLTAYTLNDGIARWSYGR